MRNVIDDVQPRDVLQIHQINCLRLLFTEYGNQDIGARDFFLTTRLHVENCALQHALEAECGLNVRIVILRHQRRLLLDELGQLPAQFGNVRVAGFEDFINPGNLEQREQHVLDCHELMTEVTSLLEGLVQAKLKFAA